MPRTPRYASMAGWFKRSEVSGVTYSVGKEKRCNDNAGLTFKKPEKTGSRLLEHYQGSIP